MGTAEKVTHVPVSGTSETKPTTRSRPAARFHDPFAEMDRMFERMIGRPLGRGWMEPLWPEWHRAGLETMPPVDVIDRDEEVLIRAEVPGVAPEDLEVTMSGNTVTFRGHVKREEEKEEGEYHYRETRRGEFTRTVTLPAEVDSSAARARHHDGVVELTLPKIATSQRRRIEVESE